MGQCRLVFIVVLIFVNLDNKLSTDNIIATSKLMKYDYLRIQTKQGMSCDSFYF